MALAAAPLTFIIILLVSSFLHRPFPKHILSIHIFG
jgi:hypothetical protein